MVRTSPLSAELASELNPRIESSGFRFAPVNGPNEGQ